MSTNGEPASAAAPADPAPDFILDFLYQDARRVGSFLAQFDPSGHLTGLKQSESVSEQTGGDGSVRVGGIALLGGLGGSVTRRTGISGSESSERSYDPFWTNARALLDFLEERRLVSRQLDQTSRLGQFVVTSGKLIVSDMSLLKVVWEIPELKKTLFDAGILQNINQAKKNNPNIGTAELASMKNEWNLMLKMIPSLPHKLQGHLLGRSVSAWFSLDENSVVGNSTDIILKHGPLLSGDWSVLGIVDALPYDPDFLADDGRSMIQLIADTTGAGAGQMAIHLAGISQRAMGRPAGYYGLTPLLIYRKVEAVLEDGVR